MEHKKSKTHFERIEKPAEKENDLSEPIFQESAIKNNSKESPDEVTTQVLTSADIYHNSDTFMDKKEDVEIKPRHVFAPPSNRLYP